MIQAKNFYKTWQEKRQTRLGEISFSIGEQDVVDLLSYDGLEEKTDHVLIDDTYSRTLFISGYPFVASSG